MSDISLKYILISISSICLIAAPVQAQLIPDNTLGRESSTVVPVSNTRDDIRGGASRGSNLFHSFQEFNVNPNSSVYFNNPPGVRNIINRVTGGNISNIFGTLGVNGNANLYLINPNGIFFGDGARLDIRGTFVGTTADGIFLGNDAVYSAKNPENSSLLTVEPGAMFVNQIRNATSSIVNQGNLEITPGGNITLSGDRIENNGAIIAPGGNVFLEAVNGNINSNNIDTIDDITGGGDITLSATNNITINGKIDASGTEVEVSNSPEIPLVPNITANSGNINLEAGNNIVFNNNSNIFTFGNLGGGINIKSANNVIGKNTLIRSLSTGNTREKGGNIEIKARYINLKQSILGSATQGVSDTGNINIETKYLRLEDGTQIATFTFEGGNAGNLSITAQYAEVIGVNPINNFTASGIISQSLGEGNTGSLSINADSLRLVNGAVLWISTFANGNSGDLTIKAKDIEIIGVNSATLSPSGLFSSSRDAFSNFTDGNAGNIKIFTQRLKIEGGGTINSSNFPNPSSSGLPSLGRAGNISIAAEEINLDRGTITASGNIKGGGDIRIDSSKFILLRDRSQITADVGQTIDFPGGNLTINSPIIIANPTNNEITARAITSSGGNININTLAIFGYPQFLNIDASSSLGIDGNINIVGLTNEINPSTIAAQQTTLSEETPPELDDCPLDLQTTSSSQENPIPARIGFCRTKKGTIMAY